MVYQNRFIVSNVTLQKSKQENLILPTFEALYHNEIYLEKIRFIVGEKFHRKKE